MLITCEIRYDRTWWSVSTCILKKSALLLLFPMTSVKGSLEPRGFFFMGGGGQAGPGFGCLPPRHVVTAITNNKPTATQLLSDSSRCTKTSSRSDFENGGSKVALVLVYFSFGKSQFVAITYYSCIFL